MNLFSWSQLFTSCFNFICTHLKMLLIAKLISPSLIQTSYSLLKKGILVVGDIVISLFRNSSSKMLAARPDMSSDRSGRSKLLPFTEATKLHSSYLVLRNFESLCFRWLLLLATLLFRLSPLFYENVHEVLCLIH